MFDHPALRNFLGILLVLSGTVSLGVTVLMLITGINYAGAPAFIAGVSVILALVCSLIYIVCGLLSTGRNGRSRAFRLMPLVQLGVFSAVLRVILGGVCGIYTLHLYILLAGAVLIPEVSLLIICAVTKLRPRLR